MVTYYTILLFISQTTRGKPSHLRSVFLLFGEKCSNKLCFRRQGVKYILKMWSEVTENLKEQGGQKGLTCRLILAVGFGQVSQVLSYDRVLLC